MVMDFGVIKKPLKDWIDENLDHGVILSPDDKKGIKMMRDAKQKIYIMPTIGWDAEGNPTSENLARVIWIAINRFPQVNRQYTMRHSVTVWETPDCSATYTNE
jgi:6-pyruvoyl-tetrahydropterin synthase